MTSILQRKPNVIKEVLVQNINDFVSHTRRVYGRMIRTQQKYRRP